MAAAERAGLAPDSRGANLPLPPTEECQENNTRLGLLWGQLNLHLVDSGAKWTVSPDNDVQSRAEATMLPQGPGTSPLLVSRRHTHMF